MKIIQPNCRVQFTAEDLDFILAVLGNKTGDRDCLIKLLADEDTRDEILDNENLFHALLEHRACLRISNHFYFYMLVRHVLRRAGLGDRKVADYVAEVLAEFCMVKRTSLQVPGHEGTIDYFFEMLAALQHADERTSFLIRAHMGNQSLFLSGVFPQRIKARAESRGFPSLRYYEAMGQAAFRMASDHRLAAEYELSEIYATLSERFQTARRALNDMSERLCLVGDDPGWDKLLHQVYPASS